MYRLIDLEGTGLKEGVKKITCIEVMKQEQKVMWKMKIRVFDNGGVLLTNTI